MRRWLTVHPQAAADAAVLIASSLCLAAARVLLAWARAGGDGIDAADLGGED